jgi:hypothetical protein
MTTEFQIPKTIISELNENANTGFTKSVDTLYNNIISYLRHRTAAGFRVCQYNYIWREFNTLMSPVHIGYYGVAQNNVLLPDIDRDKLLDAVCEKLIADKIKVSKRTAKYITSNNVNYALQFQIDLEVLSLEQESDVEPASPSHNPETHDYDFKCTSC